MKKLSLLLVALALMIGAIGFAQNNSATVTQTGNNNDGKVYQDGANNTGTILTLGNLHNDNTTIYVTWRSGAAGLMLAEGITQIGTWNTGTIDQTGHPNVTEDLPNDVSKAGIGQYGYNNSAYIYQFDYTDHIWSAQNVAFVDQFGDSNTSAQYQNGRALTSLFRQVGNSNEAISDQDTGYGNKTKAEQVGNNNYSYQYQIGNGWNGMNISDVFQVGTWNVSNTLQTGLYNDVDVYQNGYDHNSYVYQLGNYNTSDVFQSGNSHNSVVTQIGNNNNAPVTQMD